MWVKICGVQNPADALYAQECGADAIGINLHPPSPRCVSASVAAAIADAVDIESVLVVVDRDEAELGELVQAIRPSRVQLHGDEGPGYGAWLGVPCFRAFRAHAEVLDEIARHNGSPFLLDAHVPGQAGGTGKRVDAELARAATELGPMILAGGLNPDNVAEAIASIRPWGVDVASGCESSPGVMDREAVRLFVERSRRSGASR